MPPTRRIRRISEVQKSRGSREVIKRIINQANFTIKKKVHYIRGWFISDWKYLQFRLWKQALFGGYLAIADPFKTIRIGPNDIQYQSSAIRPIQYAVGTIEGGDWDQNLERVGSIPIFKCFANRFIHGKKWDETEFIQDCLYQKRTWRGCETPEEIYDRCKKMDRLYSQISREGFKSSQEINDKDAKSAIKSGERVTRYLDNILVDIGRKGEFLFVDGKHRLSIAKILDVESIPVNVLARHKEWQAIREEVAQAEAITELNNNTRQYIDHPDLTDLVPGSWRR